jgi:hypothetical protein
VYGRDVVTILRERRNHGMNKKIVFYLFIGLSLLVMACGDDNAATPETKTGATTAVTTGTENTIENFDSTSLTLYKCPKGETNFTIKSNAAHEGTGGLVGSRCPQSGDPLGGKWIYRDDTAALTSQGDRLSIWVKRSNVNPGPTADIAGASTMGFGCSAEGCYYVTLSCQTTGQTCELRVGKVLDLSNAVASSITLNAVPQTYIANRWYKIIVEWTVVGLIDVYLFDSDGMTMLNRVSAWDDTWTSGGIGFRGFGPGDYYFDTYQRYIHPMDE